MDTRSSSRLAGAAAELDICHEPLLQDTSVALLALAAVCLAAALGDERDLVVLASGKELRGRIVRVDERELVLRRSGRDQEFALKEVARFESVDAALTALLAEARPARLARKEELPALAERARLAGLAGEAANLWWHLLVLEPESRVAHEALGHELRGGRPVVPLDGRALGLAQRIELARDWGSAWRFASLHYELTTNLPLERALELGLDLERFYHAFFALFGAELGLYEVCTPMKIHVHADRASYPESAGENGRYEPDIDTVVVDASRGFQLATLVHEATHQLLFVTAFKERGGHGEIPPWLNEGLAEYVAASVVGAPPLVLEPGTPALHHFHAHASSKSAHDLARVLAFSTSDYQSSDDPALKYAQSYTLVHFLLHGEERRHRAGFLDYLRLVYAGRGSSTDLKKCLDVDWKKLARAWSEYAHAQAR
jgi:hypothetical protein